jgi:Glycine/serine hydroxymethyltransferase
VSGWNVCPGHPRFGEPEFAEVADIIAEALKTSPDLAALRVRVEALTERFPLYRELP